MSEEAVAVAENVTVSPSVISVAVEVILREGIDPLTADTAAEAFTLPPESETLSNRESKVEVSIKILLISAVDTLGSKDLIKAAIPATWGEAMDVPLKLAYPPPEIVERIPDPGAATSTLVVP